MANYGMHSDALARAGDAYVGRNKMKQLLQTLLTFVQQQLFRNRVVKIDFPIIELNGTRIGVEGIWCKQIGYNTFRIDNVPFAARDISYGDIVQCSFSLKGWQFIKKIQSSELRCARIISERDIPEQVWENLFHNLDVKYEFASKGWVSVATIPEHMTILAERVHNVSGIKIEITSS